MAIPNFLSSTYDGTPQYVKLAALNDVETGGVGIITQVRALCVTNLGWTEPSGNLFKSPVQSDGTFMDILLTRIDATHLELRLRDDAVNTICTRRLIITAGNDVYIFAGTTRLVIYSEATIKNVAHFWIIEPSPGLVADVTKRVVGSARYNAANTDDAAGGTILILFGWDNGAATNLNRVLKCATDQAANATVGGSTAQTDQSGRLWFHPLRAGGKPTSATIYYMGRLPNVLYGPANLGGGTLKTLPIDDSTNGVFFSLQAGFSNSTDNCTIWVRKS